MTNTYTGDTNERREPHGQGVYEYASGDYAGGRYDGQFKDDKRNDQGVYEYPNGDCYDGHWKDGKKHGQGVYEHASGDLAGNRYDGHWKDGKQHGQGAYEYADGDRYEGQFKDNMFHGRLFTTRSDGSGFTTLWENGKLVLTEDLQSMSRDELTLEVLKLRERVNQLSIFDQEEDSEPN